MSDIKPEILIISNRHDFASDYIAASLYNKGINFLRLNLDDLSNLAITFKPKESILTIEGLNSKIYSITPSNLKSIFFRGPTFLRETAVSDLNPNDRLSKSQWASFIRSLMIYDKCKWVNHPANTYYAENKPIQLSVAHKVGLSIPNSVITNSAKAIDQVSLNDDNIIMKGMDTVYLKIKNKKAFTYTNILKKSEIYNCDLSISPVLFQELLDPKIDLRITVIGEELFSVAVVDKDRNGIIGDWRLKKYDVQYIPFEIPMDIKKKCIQLVKELKLSYGAIDMALVGDEYYFIEINPTGEWAWLVEKSNLPIDKSITNYLITE